jgi:hypothetical protein
MLAWRAFSASFAAFAAWAAIVQLNDPDPERWIALYGSAALLALTSALGRPWPRAAGLLCVVALAWAAAIVPELLGHWQITDLGVQMSSARPEVEYGRELGGLLIVASYCVATGLLARLPLRQAHAAAQRVPEPPDSA